MTPYEYADLAQSAFGNGLSSFAVLLSIVSGYLITAYLVGAKLSKFQVRLLTTMFVLVMGLLAWSMSAYTYWGSYFAALGRNEASPESLFRPGAWTTGATAILTLLTIVMCLLFMWNIRQPKE